MLDVIPRYLQNPADVLFSHKAHLMKGGVINMNNTQIALFENAYRNILLKMKHGINI